MSLSKLYLFSKVTDATSTEQGFYYQKLITLRSWLENRLAQNDVQIYCDYEEDVFERNVSEKKSTFRQVKLYSNNFSFTTEEITKSISHFFMLYCKGEYSLDEATFIFETNSGVAKQYMSDDPQLLRDWWENQEELSQELLDRCRIKVKSLINIYINEVMSGKVSEAMKQNMLEAKKLYDSLPDEVWDAFVKSIRWKFDVIPHDQAIPQLLEELEQMVIQLPLSLEPARSSTYIAVLLAEIASRTAEKKPENKALSKDLLDILLLNMGSEEDRWYAHIFEKWQSVSEIKQFHIGEFYEIVAAARHCRWELSATDHDQLWLNLLQQYIELEETIVICHRKAIYEYIFLLLSPDPLTLAPKNSIAGTKDLFNYYFESIEHRNTFSDIENDIILLEIAATQTIINPDLLTLEDFNKYRQVIHDLIEAKIQTPRNIDELALAYQLMGHFYFHGDPAIPLKDKTLKALEYYSKIPELLNQTQTYSISSLDGQTNKILDLLIKTDADIEATVALEEFLGTTEEYASKTGQGRKSAKGLVQRSASYISKPSVRNYLAALTNLHKAKDYCNNDDSRTEFIVILLNISKVYSGLGMNLASKYFGLSAVYTAEHLGDHSTYKLISDACAEIFHADFQQGAWISAIDDFHIYMISRMEFQADPPDLELDKAFREVILDLSFILTAGEIIHPEMKPFLEFQKQKTRWIYENYIEEVDKGFRSVVENEEKLKKILQKKLSAVPFSDLGQNRKITFDSLGISWKICFANTYNDNAISEEFVALLQIILCEIGLTGADLHLIEMPITINIGQADSYNINLSQHPSHEETIFNLQIPILAKTDPAVIPAHYGFLNTTIRTILSNISLLPDKEFYDTFGLLFEKQALASKSLVKNAYQRVYYNFVDQEQFNMSRRSDFNGVAISDFVPAVSGLYIKFDDLSPKYSQSQALECITNRYKNTVKKFSVSMEAWKKDPQFIALIKSLRESGWLDWQIMLALMNFVISNKVSMIIEKNPPENKEEGKQRAEILAREMLEQNENDNYIRIPASWLVSDRFKFFMNEMPVRVLESYGLQNGLKHPNFKMLRNYLAKRIAFSTDDLPELSALQDIK